MTESQLEKAAAKLQPFFRADSIEEETVKETLRMIDLLGRVVFVAETVATQHRDAFEAMPEGTRESAEGQATARLAIALENAWASGQELLDDIEAAFDEACAGKYLKR